MLLEKLREQVYRANMALPAHNLVTWTSGNVSGRDPETGLIVIKPSGVLFDELTPENMAIVDLEGRIVEATHGPSTDTESHLYIYQHRSDVNGITHTHSNYATAFAAVGKPIPVCLTAIADEFGAEIPCGDYVRIGGQAIGAEILRRIGASPAILMKQHGVFTIGATVHKALQAAVMVEDVARTVWLALQVGRIETLPAAEIAANFERYQTRYGTFAASRKQE
ncbi:MAG: class II aldolase/adducin family protein [Chloroflexi bacterium]|nr:class II aldolase/adducin family protein [Chloroflexota bacterium]